MSTPDALRPLAVLLVACALCSAAFAQAAAPPPTIQEMVARARRAALDQFRNRRNPSQWHGMLRKDLGPLRFDNTPTAEAAKAVAAKLGLPMEVAAGVEGTVTYNRTGTLAEFLRDGLNPRYWLLSLAEGKLKLQPVVSSVGGQVPAERGLYYSERPQELEALGAKCGALKAYSERVTIDGAGAVSIRGRMWFIDKVRAELGLTEGR